MPSPKRVVDAKDIEAVAVLADEIWNEHFGGRVTDKGPTGGGRLVIRLPDGFGPT